MSIIQKAILTYGKEHQLNKAVEECSEFVDALMKFRDGRDTIDHLAEELADVRIMLKQVEQIYGIALDCELWERKR